MCGIVSAIPGIDDVRWKARYRLAERLAAATAEPEPVATRPVIFDDGAHDSKVYDRAGLFSGHRLQGPAVIEEPASVTIIPPGLNIRVDTYGNLLLGEIATAPAS